MKVIKKDKHGSTHIWSVFSSSWVSVYSASDQEIAALPQGPRSRAIAERERYREDLRRLTQGRKK